jgi:hypothetical protein
MGSTKCSIVEHKYLVTYELVTKTSILCVLCKHTHTIEYASMYNMLSSGPKVGFYSNSTLFKSGTLYYYDVLCIKIKYKLRASPHPSPKTSTNLSQPAANSPRIHIGISRNNSTLHLALVNHFTKASFPLVIQFEPGETF